ncbi:PLDc N-terminal domain-containing protein [Tomitella fengzijianii]|uniref:Cardiolipin synthase N-terminal domain-containing protein n=1 Tax=Tomitella fengzijianii TaxID=2597660 RepID=A0A516X6A6_9ACTN|nr:PLDc N-terminal domain-containing protein [Tomitella fengzijianii]QDQ98585.1 hypothetical protein FO059_16225 [Tomitella fengzijianii]
MSSSTFLDVFWLILISVAFVVYLMLLFTIFGDLFRDHETSGWVKAIWVVVLIIFPLISSLVYLVVRGGGMAGRSRAAAARMMDAQDAYIKQTAGTSPAQQISDAQQLLDAGSITAEEFAALKAKALA